IHAGLADCNRAVPRQCVSDENWASVVARLPHGYPSSFPPVVAGTSRLAVVRCHGRSQSWASKSSHERFGYLYTEQELQSWADDLGELAEQTRVVHVLMNNCYRDYAQVNAAQLAQLLTG